MMVGILEQESTGGAVARKGLNYQDAYVLQQLPQWLSEDAFSHVVSEAVGDIHVCYFDGPGKVIHHFHEAKDSVLSVAKFWDEIQRFRTVNAASPAEFPSFVLLCRDYHQSVAPFVAKSRRLRGVGSAFDDDSAVIAGDVEATVAWAVEHGQHAELARFAVDRVEFVTYSAEHAEESFAGEVAHHLPTLDLTSSKSIALRDKFKDLVLKSSFKPITRRVLEDALVQVLGRDAELWQSTSSAVGTSVGGAELLWVDATGFNGLDRADRTAEDWQNFSAELTATATFLKESRLRRSVALDGKQRMTTACVLGHAFAATKSFTLTVQHNGVTYRTDSHERAEGPFFTASKVGDLSGEFAVAFATISFPTAVGGDARRVASALPADTPQLHLASSRVVDGQASLNLAVAEAKAALVALKAEHGVRTLHLVVKAPSVFAMVLGHRLNGLCDLQLYDWLGEAYGKAARITASSS